MRAISRAGRRLYGVRYAFGAIVLVLIVWELVARVGNVQADVLPPFSSVVGAFWHNHHLLLKQSWVTLKEAITGFALSVLVGVPLGTVLALSRPLDRSVRPILVAGQVTPKVALAPLFLALFGLGAEPKIVLAFLLGFFPIVLDTILGLRSIEIEKIYLARSCGASWLTILVKIRLPNALPLIMTGMKIAATLSVTGAIVAEYISPGHGLGLTIVTAGAELRTSLLFAAILCLGVLGLAMFVAITQVEKIAVGWHPSQRSRGARAR
jgi:NitT/TauT family transport system permease protein